MCFTQKDEPAQTLLFDRAQKPFRMGIALRNLGWAKNDFQTGRFENLSKVITVLGIAVDDQVRLVDRETVNCVNELTSGLLHPTGVGRNRRAAHMGRSVTADQ